MKKSTILVIVIVYLVSIVAIAFFGMKSKVYDEIKYVKEIQMSVEAEDPEMFTFKEKAPSQSGNKQYELKINFNKAMLGNFETEDGITETRKYVALNFIPHVTYDTGDVADAKEEKIKYVLSSVGEDYMNKGYISLSNRGELMCFREKSFRLYVEPESKGSFKAMVIIDVYVERF